MSDPEIKLLSLFSGAGGLDIGAHAAGLTTALAVDLDEEALSLLRSQLGSPTLTADLAHADPEEVLEKAGIRSGEPRILIGGPPCTGFSHAGFWLEGKRNGSDPAVSLLGHYTRFVQAVEPVVWVLENVPGLTFKNFSRQLEAFNASMRSLGYSVHGRVLNAASFGVPQRRRRFFMVGLAGKQRPFTFPEPIFSKADQRSAAWAFAGLDSDSNPPEPDEELSGRYRPLLPEVPPGDNYLYFTEKRGHPDPQFKWRSRYWSFLKKLSPDEPSNTVPATRVTNNGPFHWENRHLRIRELARLQGFPDTMGFRPTEEHRRYIGNAVPPLLAAAVLQAVVEQTEELAGILPRRELEQAWNPAATAVEVSRALTELETGPGAATA